MNSETPETDQQAHWTTFEDGFWGVERCSAATGTWVPIDFARRLELRCKRLEEALRKELENRLELFEDKPHYVHSATCPNYCDYACNGEYGFELASALTDYQEEKP